MSVKTQIYVYDFSMDNKQSYHLWKEYICRINIIQYLPLKYSESCLLGTPVTQQPCVFSNAETEFSWSKTDWTWLSIFQYFSLFFVCWSCWQCIFSVHETKEHQLICHLKLCCQNDTKSYGQLHGQHCPVILCLGLLLSQYQLHTSWQEAICTGVIVSATFIIPALIQSLKYNTCPWDVTFLLFHSKVQPELVQLTWLLSIHIFSTTCQKYDFTSSKPLNSPLLTLGLPFGKVLHLLMSMLG